MEVLLFFVCFYCFVCFLFVVVFVLSFLLLFFFTIVVACSYFRVYFHLVLSYIVKGTHLSNFACLYRGVSSEFVVY